MSESKRRKAAGLGPRKIGEAPHAAVLRKPLRDLIPNDIDRINQERRAEHLAKLGVTPERIAWARNFTSSAKRIDEPKDEDLEP